MLDIDICGPSIPKVFGCEEEQVHHRQLWVVSRGEPSVGARGVYHMTGVLGSHFGIQGGHFDVFE